MKILDVRFKNLNSLHGEWCIDFTRPNYVSDGIFAITGPTGAGKSTILDAICLALYGRTPRLKNITQSTNEIMSRRTGECFAEVTFMSQAGVFRCCWSQHRARRNPNGNLAAPLHEIAEIKNGERDGDGVIIEDKKSRIGAVVVEKTGMDFDRFTRSMLLAQGGFSVFLEASSGDRAPILEQITGTEVYSRISVCVHERHRAENEKLDFLRAETDGLVMFSVEEEAAKRAELDEQQAEWKTLSEKKEQRTLDVRWLKEMDSLKQELQVIDAEYVALQSELIGFEPEKQRLLRALQASELDCAYATLISARKQYMADQEQCKQLVSRLPESEQAVAEALSRLIAAEKITQEAKDAQLLQQECIKQMRRMDQSIDEQSSRLQDQQTEFDRTRLILLQHEKEREQAEVNREQAQKKLDDLELYLTVHAADAALVTERSGLDLRLSQLQDFFEKGLANAQQIAKGAHTLASAEKALNQVERDHLRHQKKVERSKIQEDAARTSLKALLGDRLLREYRNEKDCCLREMAFLQKIAGLEEERAKLVDGKPCPLCGAVQHPFASGHVPQIDETERRIASLSQRIDQAEQLEQTIVQQEKTTQIAEAACRLAEKQLVQVQQTLSEEKNALQRLITEQDDLSRRDQLSQLELLERLAPFGIAVLPQKLHELSTALLQRQQAWQQHSDKKAEWTQLLHTHQIQIQKSHGVIETLTAAHNKNHEMLQKAKAVLAERKAHRKTTYGTKNPDDEEQKSMQLVAASEKQEKINRRQHALLEQQRNGLQVQIHDIKERITREREDLDVAQMRFSAQCLQRNMADEMDYLAQSLPPEQRNALAQQAKMMDDRVTNLEIRKKDRSERLISEQIKKRTDQSVDVLQIELQTLTAKLAEMGEHIGALKQQLKNNEESKKTFQEKRKAIEKQQCECIRWNRLHELIGSAEGKKFRNYAQGLTFELLVHHANQQLAKLTDRYLLLRSDSESLELKVMDNYQDVTRSTKNLSGGESFIVSLSLALGLSKMASHKVRVDSLFLDEGFGTLDEDALETALDTLAGLQQEGKLIGVISHVSALKERINTQINVIPVTGGRSAIEGPGVSGSSS